MNANEMFTRRTFLRDTAADMGLAALAIECIVGDPHGSVAR
jgi:hypothetical protein